MKSIDRCRGRRYPTVRVSHCKHFDIYTMPLGAHYCPKCNAIILDHLCLFHNEEIEELTPLILSHETIHWWLCKNINEEASLGFDAINEEIDSL
jgi:hypothetical protein